MASASLLPMICPHSVDQRIDRDLVAVRQEEILPNTHWCIAEFGRYVLIHETVPYFTQQRERDNVVPFHSRKRRPPTLRTCYVAGRASFDSRIHATTLSEAWSMNKTRDLQSRGGSESMHCVFAQESSLRGIVVTGPVIIKPSFPDQTRRAV
jgi:hypothetical protein